MCGRDWLSITRNKDDDHLCSAAIYCTSANPEWNVTGLIKWGMVMYTVVTIGSGDGLSYIYGSCGKLDPYEIIFVNEISMKTVFFQEKVLKYVCQILAISFKSQCVKYDCGPSEFIGH